MKQLCMTISSVSKYFYNINVTDNSMLDENFVLPRGLTLDVMREAKLPMRSVIQDYMIQDEQSMIDLMGEYIDMYPFN